MSSGPGVLGLVVGPLLAQFAVYLALARFAFALPIAQAAAVALVRVLLGGVLFWLLMGVTLGNAPSVGGVLAVSAPVAWFVAALMDPRRSVQRAIGWVLLGTVVTFSVNEVYWRALTGESVLSADSRWSFG